MLPFDAWTELPNRAVVAITGAEAKDFLQGLLTNDVDRLTPGHALYAALLTPQGKLLIDMVLAQGPDAILIDVAGEHRGELMKRLTLYKLRAKVAFEDRSATLGVAAAWWEAARDGKTPAEMAGQAEAVAGGVLFHDPRLAALGARLIGPRAALASAFPKARPCTPDDFVRHRLAQGVAEGADIAGERTYPLEANFEALNGVDFKKGCYVGQELTARMKHRAGLRKRVLPVNGAAALPDVGTPVTAGGRPIGELLACRDRRGLALLRLDHLAEAERAPLEAGAIAVTLEWPQWLPK